MMMILMKGTCPDHHRAKSEQLKSLIVSYHDNEEAESGIDCLTLFHSAQQRCRCSEPNPLNPEI
jgi:hypothetical protein